MSKAKGIASELLFRHECLTRGIVPSIPDGDNSPYDAIIECDKKLFKVQIKSTNTKNHTGYKVACSHGSTGKRAYCSSDVDYFAFYIFERSVWFIIPIAEIKSKNINLYPDKLNHRYSKYKEAWWVFFDRKDLKTSV